MLIQARPFHFPLPETHLPKPSDSPLHVGLGTQPIFRSKTRSAGGLGSENFYFPPFLLGASDEDVTSATCGSHHGGVTSPRAEGQCSEDGRREEWSEQGLYLMT